MADFRKLVYALVLVGTFMGLAGSAQAQGLFCDSLTAIPQIVRSEGYTELVGDITMQCRATINGVSTPVGNFVPAANIHITIPNTTITSRTVSSGFIEPLLMIDDPGQVAGTSAPQVYCGKGGNDSGPSGRGVCQIVEPSDPSLTYDGCRATGGANNCQWTSGNNNTACTATTYSCGRPNVYQGRLDSPNSVTFPGVPLDPPGTNGVRTIRITNIRINATNFDPINFPQISAFVTIEGTASVTLQKNDTIVATVAKGMGATVVKSDKGFLQCIAETSPGHGQNETITVTEGFRSAWRPRNVGEYVSNYVGTSTLAAWLVSGSPYAYNGSGTTNSLVDTRQNIPAFHYFTEDGFYLDPATTGTENGINKSGTADYGTRITFAVSAPPSGTTLTIPTVVTLSNGTNTTGVMVMTAFTDPGTGVYTPVSGSSFTIPAAGARVVYEVIFSDPFSIESAVIPGTLSYTAPTTDAAVGVTTTVDTASFAPFYASVGTDANGIPRFKPSTPNTLQDFVLIGKCSCSLLFPWVVTDNNYVTGIAIANTSMDPTNTANTAIAINGYSAALQSGKITVYYFGQTGSNPTQSGTAAQTASAPSATVAAGGFATFLAPSGFAGYAIANSQFQYCHGVAFLFSLSGSVPPMSYLGLVMDGKVNASTLPSGNAVPLQRTNQVFKDALDN